MRKNLRLEGTETDVTSCAVRHTPPDPVQNQTPQRKGDIWQRWCKRQLPWVEVTA